MKIHIIIEQYYEDLDALVRIPTTITEEQIRLYNAKDFERYLFKIVELSCDSMSIEFPLKDIEK